MLRIAPLSQTTRGGILFEAPMLHLPRAFKTFAEEETSRLLSISCSSTPATITNTPSGRSSLGSLSCHPQRKSCFTIQTWGSHGAAEMVAFNGLGTIIGV